MKEEIVERKKSYVISYHLSPFFIFRGIVSPRLFDFLFVSGFVFSIFGFLCSFLLLEGSPLFFLSCANGILVLVLILISYEHVPLESEKEANDVE